MPSGLSVDSDETVASATVSTFRLDAYEVTIGRFRKFVDAVVAGWTPSVGSGKHAHVSGGEISGETGWLTEWTTTGNLPTSKATWDSPSYLACPADPIWTSSPAGSETRPVGCVTWYQAYAFCIWDGGFLPTEAEWELAASGGEERVFPWSIPASSTAIDSTYATLDCQKTPCVTSFVGAKPKGIGRYGHSDLAGNVQEWVLDTYQNPFPFTVCNDCVAPAAPPTWPNKTMRGGGFSSGMSDLRSAARIQADSPTYRSGALGIRCARRP